jgi:hypothetical protein
MLLNFLLIYLFSNYDLIETNSLFYIFVIFLNFFFNLFIRYSFFCYLLIMKVFRFSKFLVLIVTVFFFDSLWFVYLFSTFSLLQLSFPFFIFKFLFTERDQDFSSSKYKLSIILLIFFTNDFCKTIQIFSLLFIQEAINRIRNFLG